MQEIFQEKFLKLIFLNMNWHYVIWNEENLIYNSKSNVPCYWKEFFVIIKKLSSSWVSC